MSPFNNKLRHLVGEMKDENMRENKPEKKLALGIDAEGNKVVMPYVNHLFFEKKNLIKLDLPEMCKSLYCEGNLLTEIKLQYTMVEVWCFNNKIKELDVPHGVEDLRCEGNEITTLYVPSSVDWLTCDKELFDYDTCSVKQVNIIYE